MRQEGQEEEDDGDENVFDDTPDNFVLCALHQAKILRARWKFWSGSVPANVSVRLHRLESRLSIKEESQQRRSTSTTIEPSLEPLKNHSMDISSNALPIPLRRLSKMNSSEPFLAEKKDSISIDQYFSERIEPKHNIILQGPDIRRISVRKRRSHFWCCH
ncbi:unnamed protein product [Rotaria socialis]|uniref:Uncharacterized protein n=1 Tax=Rotaria socialis TaxID=392032 RepID=A0A820A0T2_9BILA|nr:unnamed protein product [Rotaria socialis]CAF3317201.1 unnamed protein product [Rotaria socialis]CAF3526367.1 unnamed protein product [Rotaria socialis]CAF3628707.1 unnamed protein product [Rotaria socialis]CAF4183722.1 unnamed protein product [Rotaria socialis]